MLLIVNQVLGSKATTAPTSLALVENIVVVEKMPTIRHLITDLATRIALCPLFRPVLQGKRAAQD